MTATIPELTTRERQFLILKANGYMDQQAADAAGVSVRTVTKALERVYRKLGVRNAPQAVAVAVAIGEIGIYEITIPDTERNAA